MGLLYCLNPWKFSSYPTVNEASGGAVVERHRTTIREVTVSSTDGVLKFFIDSVPGVDSLSNSNEYQEYFLGVKAVGP